MIGAVFGVAFPQVQTGRDEFAEVGDAVEGGGTVGRGNSGTGGRFDGRTV